MFGFVTDSLDRQLLERNEEIIKAAWEHRDARMLVFYDGDPVFSQSENSVSLFPVSVFDFFQEQQKEAIQPIYLGVYNNHPTFAIGVKKQDVAVLEGTAYSAINLRSAILNPLVSPQKFTLLGLARSLVMWHEHTSFCSKCGTPLHSAQGGFRQDCPKCATQYFPRIDPVVIMLVAKGDKCLLGSGRNFEAGRFSCLAGFMETGETIEATVRRETMEEAGIKVGTVHYVTSQPWPFSNQLMIGCQADALTEIIAFDDDEMVDVRWFSKKEAQQLLAGKLEGLSGPPPAAIAHHLIQGFINEEI